MNTTEGLENIALGITTALLVFSLTLHQEILVILAIFIIIGLILKLKIIYQLARIWHSLFSRAITYISNILLALIYLLIMTPYSWIYRSMNRNKVSTFLSGPEERSSYYLTNKNFKPKDFESPW